MTMIVKLLGRSLVTGLVATIVSSAATAAVAIAEGKGPAQPLNATSHLIYGDEAADYRDADIDHTAVGLATHAAATVFWATAFEIALLLRPPRTKIALLDRAAGVAMLAAVIDYTITPKRFTPGWELVLSKTAMAVVYAAMAASFAAAAARRPAR